MELYSICPLVTTFLSFSIMSLRLIHVVARLGASFLEAGEGSVVCVHHVWFPVHPRNEHRGHFYLLAIVKTAALKGGVQTPLSGLPSRNPEVELREPSSAR